MNHIAVQAQSRVYSFGDLVPLASSRKTTAIESFLRQQSMENLTKHVRTVTAALVELGNDGLEMTKALLSGRDESSPEAKYWSQMYMRAFVGMHSPMSA